MAVRSFQIVSAATSLSPWIPLDIHNEYGTRLNAYKEGTGDGTLVIQYTLENVLASVPAVMTTAGAPQAFAVCTAVAATAAVIADAPMAAVRFYQSNASGDSVWKCRVLQGDT